MFFFLMIRRPPRSTLDRSSAASDVYKRQALNHPSLDIEIANSIKNKIEQLKEDGHEVAAIEFLSLIHISEPTRPY